MIRNNIFSAKQEKQIAQELLSIYAPAEMFPDEKAKCHLLDFSWSISSDNWRMDFILYRPGMVANDPINLLTVFRLADGIEVLAGKLGDKTKPGHVPRAIFDLADNVDLMVSNYERQVEIAKADAKLAPVIQSVKLTKVNEKDTAAS